MDSTHQSNCQDLTVNNQPACNMLVVVTLAGGVLAFNAGDTASSGGSGAGATIWSRTTQCSGSSCAGTTNYFWYDDCGANTGVSTIVGMLPYAGIVGTPVIDTSVTPPLMYVTSLCSTSSSLTNREWFLHQIRLDNGNDTSYSPVRIKGTLPASGSLNADDVSTGPPNCATGQTCIPFLDYEVYNHAGLLKLGFSGASQNPLIYFSFGAASFENSASYHGWIFAYDSTLTRRVIFATTTQGCGTGTQNQNLPSCNTACYCSSTGWPNNCTGNTCKPSGYNTAPNWVGHSGGSWTSGRAVAGNVLSVGGTNVGSAYFAVGNGGFQQWQSDHTTFLNPIQNWGESILAFTLTGSGFDQSPSQYFIPFGDVAVEPPAVGLNPAYTYQGLNQNDFDLGVCGILLFEDLAGNHRLLTCDKAGYGYLLTQGNLCGDLNSKCYPGVSQANGGQPGFKDKDPGDGFPFAMSLTQCPDKPTGGDTACDRITSMALYPGTTQRLYFWPSYESLTTLQLSDGTTQISGSPQITWTSGSTTIQFNTACTPGTNCFTDQVVPGDTLVACSCTGTNCPIVTGVASSGSSITVNQALPTSCTTPQNWSYTGYFVNPIRDSHPQAQYVQYQGGVVEVTSNSGSGTVVWGLADVGNSTNEAQTANSGGLYEYDNVLDLLWCSSSTNCTSNTSTFTVGNTNRSPGTSFAAPTVVNGYMYIPTYGITGVASNSHLTCSASSPCSGVLVYSGH